MRKLPHFRLENTQESIPYTYAGGGGSTEFRSPVRDPSRHHAKLREELDNAQMAAKSRRNGEGLARPQVLERKPEGFVLTFESEKGYELKLESFERKKHGTELVSLSVVDGKQLAKVFVPDGQLIGFLRVLDDYSTLKNGKRPNKNFIESISAVRLALVEDFWEDSLPFPDSGEIVWWEVWLRGRRRNAEDIKVKFDELAASVEIRVKERFVIFPERVVVLAQASARQLAESLDLLAMVAELRRAKILSGPYLDLRPSDQQGLVRAVLGAVTSPADDAPAVCLFDGGIDRGHPLLEVALAQADMHAVEAEWGTADHDYRYKHGTGMAGIALYGCLTTVLSGAAVSLRHRLESVTILPPPPRENDPESYGAITQEAGTKVLLANPERNRVYCMAITSDSRDNGLPTSWSAAVDEMCAGVLDQIPKIMCVSAGNVRQELHAREYRYPEWNLRMAGVEDPAQAWNSLTVGAFTEKVMIQDPSYGGYQPIAGFGDLCPTSRTSFSWVEDGHNGWPIKPDIVMEGGNYAEKQGNRTAVEDLALLTTRLYPGGRLFDITCDTSPATAAAARMLASLWSHYPHLRPETLRALIVHSARWTPAMIRSFPSGSKASVLRRLRVYGYGVPDLARAVYSAENAATLIFEGELQPFHRQKSEIRSNEMHLHALPWPREVLEGLGATEVSMRVTLSYFVEPSPGRVGWGRNHRYASHGLRFDVVRPYEDVKAFRRRISRAEWDNPKDSKARPSTTGETRDWVIGAHGRSHGSIHSDSWTGTAADLAQCSYIAIYPVTGWWRERPHLERYSQSARYSLVVSLETEQENVDLYSAIAVLSEVSTEAIV